MGIETCTPWVRISLSTSSGNAMELGVFSVAEEYFSAMEEAEGKKAESAAEERRGKWRRR